LGPKRPPRADRSRPRSADAARIGGHRCPAVERGDSPRGVPSKLTRKTRHGSDGVQFCKIVTTANLARNCNHGNLASGEQPRLLGWYQGSSDDPARASSQGNRKSTTNPRLRRFVYPNGKRYRAERMAPRFSISGHSTHPWRPVSSLSGTTTTWCRLPQSSRTLLQAAVEQRIALNDRRVRHDPFPATTATSRREPPAN
jgi:hypothetical protein